MDPPEQTLNDLRPSFFELYAQERLTSALRPALRYLLEVLSVRRLSLLKLAERSDELFLLISSFVELHQLSRKNSTLSESFYGLRRSTSFATPPPTTTTTSHNTEQGLTRGQILTSWFFTLVVPYIKLKLDQYFINHRPSQQDSLLFHPNQTQSPIENQTHSQTPQTPSLPQLRRILRKLFSRNGLRLIYTSLRNPQLRQRLHFLFVEHYPTANALYETIIFIFNILYLFNHTRYYNPFLAIQRLVIRRITVTDLVGPPQLGQDGAFDAHGESGLSMVWRGLKGLGDTAITGVKCGFIVGVFLIRFLEFYYAAESRLPRKSVYIPPPPEPLPPSGNFDKELIKLTNLCPLCRNVRSNPAACASSGYVFCYACIFTYIQEHAKCPITKVDATVEDIVRVYYDQQL